MQAVVQVGALFPVPAGLAGAALVAVQIKAVLLGQQIRAVAVVVVETKQLKLAATAAPESSS